MKKLLLLFLFVSVGLNAQFNYQAIVKDSDGNPVTNNQVKFKFSLMYQSSTATPVFVEEHNITTPADGVVNLSVGGGTVVNGTFSNIDWSQSVFMKEELDTGNGYEDMGTKQIASVPVAEYAKSSGSSISSLTFVDSSNNLAIGTSVSLDGERNVAIGVLALTDENSNAKYNVGIGYGALSNIASGTGNVAIGDGSLPYLEKGFNNIALGAEALFYNKSDNNIAIGGRAMSNNTSGTLNIAVGTISLYNNSDGSNSIAIGHEALYGSIGAYNIAIGNKAMYSSSNTSSNTGYRNLAIGYNALYENSGGQGNVAIGSSSLYSNSNGTENVAIGNSSLFNNLTGGQNIAIGNALYSNTSGDTNIGIGVGAMDSNTTGNSNIAIGYYALSKNVSGTDNVAVGLDALHNSTASRNTALGSLALRNNTTGTINTAVGFYSLVHNETGGRNVGLGDGSLYYNEDGSYNVALGNLALTRNVSGSSNVSIGDASLYNSISSNNVALGDGAGYDLNTENSNENTFIGNNANTVSGTQINNSTAIGANSIVTTSNTIQLGDDYVTLINTSGTVSATSFRGNADELTLTDSGTIVTLLYKISQLENEIDQLKNHQSNTTSISAYEFFEKHGGKIWASSNTDNSSSDLAVGNGYLQFSVLNQVLSNNKVATDLYVSNDGVECLNYFLGDNPDDNCSGMVIQLVSNTSDEVVFKTIDYDECENGSDGSIEEITFTIIGDRMYSSEVGESTYNYYTLVSSVQGTNCFD
ncbi:MAG: hypothetical protein L7S72_08815 [Flavobacteriales bacterium]|nr:hypothetical protein [Flavobacteriales bacterium]